MENPKETEEDTTVSRLMSLGAITILHASYIRLKVVLSGRATSEISSLLFMHVIRLNVICNSWI